MIKSKWVIPTMAFSEGKIVANLYCSQPILGDIANMLGRSDQASGRITMLTQLGY